MPGQIYEIIKNNPKFKCLLILLLKAILALLEDEPPLPCPSIETDSSNAIAVVELSAPSESVPTKPPEMATSFTPSELVNLVLLRRAEFCENGTPFTWFSETEFDVFLVLAGSGPEGLIAEELAPQVAEWVGTTPSVAAIQSIISSITCKCRKAKIPVKCCTANAAPSPSPSGRGRKRAFADGTFRVFMKDV